MAEIRVEPKPRAWTRALVLVIGLAAVAAVVYYFFVYRNA
jgi:hypothetical protein